MTGTDGRGPASHATRAPERPAGTRSRTASARDDAERRPEAESITPSFAQRLRSGRLWLLIGVLALLGAVMTALIQGAASTGNAIALDPESPRPNGAKALVQVMATHGVDVHVTSSLAETTDAMTPDARDTTIVLRQLDVWLSPEQLHELRDLGAAKLVLIQPGPAVLDALDTAIRSGGTASADDTQVIEVGDACNDPLAQNAPAITRLGGSLYSLESPAPGGDGNPDLSGCYPVNERYSVAIDATGETEVVAIGAADALTNERIAYDSNGAMAIGLMGDTERLVWYVPGYDDLATDDGLPTLESLVPPWLTPAILLTFAVGVATMVWRGRRLGPLVTERLPVVVPASETMEGRARLYGRTGSRLRALDNLRIGTIGRLARALALPATSPAHEVAIAVAQTAQRPRAEVLAILIEATPANDRELVELSDHLLQLEQDCLEALAIPTEGTSRTGTQAEPDASRRTPRTQSGTRETGETTPPPRGDE